jgi:hypothetical protein
MERPAEHGMVGPSSSLESILSSRTATVTFGG